MAKFIEELLLSMINALIRGWVNALFLKAATWLDTRVHGRAARIVVGLLLGLAAFFVFPIVSGLVSGLLSF